MINLCLIIGISTHISIFQLIWQICMNIKYGSRFLILPAWGKKLRINNSNIPWTLTIYPITISCLQRISLWWRNPYKRRKNWRFCGLNHFQKDTQSTIALSQSESGSLWCRRYRDWAVIGDSSHWVRKETYCNIRPKIKTIACGSRWFKRPKLP